MFRLIWALSVRTRYFLRRYMPTNILLDAIRTRRGLKWGMPAMLLAIPYLYAAGICVQVIEDGGPGWLHLLVLLFIYNAMKFTVMGPISLVLLLRARGSRVRRAQGRAPRRPPVDGHRVGRRVIGKYMKKTSRRRCDEGQFPVRAVQCDPPDLHKLCEALIRLTLQEVGQ